MVPQLPQQGRGKGAGARRGWPLEEGGEEIIPRLFLQPSVTCRDLMLFNHRSLECTLLNYFPKLGVPSPGRLDPPKLAETKCKPLPAAIFPASMCVSICELSVLFSPLHGPKSPPFLTSPSHPEVALICPHHCNIAPFPWKFLQLGPNQKGLWLYVGAGLPIFKLCQESTAIVYILGDQRARDSQMTQRFLSSS